MQHFEESENRIFVDCEKSSGNLLELLLRLKVSGKQLRK